MVCHLLGHHQEFRAEPEDALTSPTRIDWNSFGMFMFQSNLIEKLLSSKLQKKDVLKQNWFHEKKE